MLISCYKATRHLGSRTCSVLLFKCYLLQGLAHNGKIPQVETSLVEETDSEMGRIWSVGET